MPDARAPGAEPAPAEAAERTSLGELAALFVRLGATAFGGPAPHIAMMQDEVVTRRRWLSEERFLDPASAVLLVRFKINSTWLVLGGAALGWVMHAARGG